MARTDHLVRCITADGCITAMAVDSTETVQTAQALHHASAVASAALGRLMTGALLMGGAIKTDRATVTLRVNGLEQGIFITHVLLLFEHLYIGP